MNNTLIVMIFFVVLVLVDLLIKVYYTKKNEKPEESKDNNEKLLTDFLLVISGICRDCLKILEAEKTMSPDEYEDMLAKKVLDTFKSTIAEHYKDTYVIEIINALPEEFIIKWIKDNVFTLDEFANSIKRKLESNQPEQVNIVNEITEANK